MPRAHTPAQAVRRIPRNPPCPYLRAEASLRHRGILFSHNGTTLSSTDRARPGLRPALLARARVRFAAPGLAPVGFRTPLAGLLAYLLPLARACLARPPDRWHWIRTWHFPFEKRPARNSRLARVHNQGNHVVCATQVTTREVPRCLKCRRCQRGAKKYAAIIPCIPLGGQICRFS